MKIYLTLLSFLTIITSLFSQELAIVSENQNPLVQKWRTNFVVGSESYQETLMQSNIDLEQVNENPFGTFIQFTQDGTFVAYNNGFCGNDCRVMVYGKYITTNNDLLEFIVDRIAYHKMCAGKPTEHVSKSMGTYRIIAKNDGFVLVKIKEN